MSACLGEARIIPRNYGCSTMDKVNQENNDDATASCRLSTLLTELSVHAKLYIEFTDTTRYVNGVLDNLLHTFFFIT